jgi:serine/threonine protein kinase/tetratricopeptide (TPR) repeat protein
MKSLRNRRSLERACVPVSKTCVPNAAPLGSPLTSDDEMALAPGDQFGRYAIEGVLGSGGGGRVYRAHDPVLLRAVALKILGGDTATMGTAGKARILHEARAAAALDHPHAVAIFDVGEHDGVPYIAMECITGRTLRAYVGESSVPMEQRVRWLGDVALALAAAHKRGLVHRDVKPENVMVRDDGYIKVLDFGIARAAALDPTGPTVQAQARGVTATSSGAGTPQYMAPEQMRDEPLDGRTDQFAWGIVAYELLTGGAMPWDGSRGWLRYLTELMTEPPIPLRDRAGGVAPDLAAVVMRALQRSPSDRFASMDDLLAALDRRDHSTPQLTRPSAAPAPERGTLRSEEHATTGPVSSTHDPTPPRARVGSKARAIDAACFVAIVVFAAYATLAAPGPEPTQAEPASATAPVSTAITRLPIPESSSREALASYMRGIQSLRDGDQDGASLAFESAADLDPMLAQAHLRLAIEYGPTRPTRARLFYQKARQLRSRLDERDASLLDAFAPYTVEAAADTAEWTRRLDDLLARYPGDAEIASYVAAAKGETGDLPGSLEAAERALAADPEYAGSLWLLAQDQAYVGDFDGALRTLDQCISRTASSSKCTSMRADLYRVRGECAAIATDARRLLAQDPTLWLPRRLLADAMLALDATPEALRANVDQDIAARPVDVREVAGARALTLLAMAEGDFPAAEAHAREFERRTATDSAVQHHAQAADMLVDIYAETGRAADAGAVARTFLAAEGAWESETRAEDEGIATDPTLRMLSAMRTAGLITPEAFAVRRKDWLDRWVVRAPPFYRGYVWLHGVADGVHDEAQARDALQALPGYGGLPPFRPNDDPEVPVGWVYFLAGRTEEALPLLRASAGNCSGFRAPLAHVRARYLLGRALQAGGDAPGACVEYRAVLERWGKARPRSVTADDARTRARALRCPP